MVRVSSTRVSSARAPNSISGGSNTLCKGENGFATIPCRIRIAGRGPWIRYHPRQHDAIHNRSSSLSAERGVGPLRCFTVDHTRPLDQVASLLAAALSSESMAATSGDGGAAACPAYPWPNDGVQRGRKVFMQSDCAACHTSLPYAGLSDDGARARAAAVEPKAAEIVVVEEARQPAAETVNGGANSPDLTLITKGLRGNLYATAAPRMLAGAAAACQELKKRAMASPVWL
uniref:Cytochrome c domain-containing protein n=2 Tax=Oryza TaxID=4527 RepID=A0A0E0NMQ4_ORYRU